MSVQATTWVWEHSESGGNARLVLLAIADAADADGDNAWPTQERIARMVKVSVRTVRRLVAELVMLGELAVIEHGGGTIHHRDDRRPHLYRLTRMSGTEPLSPPPSSDKRPTGGHGATNGRTRRDERADTVVPLTSLIPNVLTSLNKEPSGGQPPAAVRLSLETPTPEPQEDTVAPPAEEPALFDIAHVQDESAGKTTKATPTQLVVAAFVDSHQVTHGRPPTGSAKGRVARDAKQLLASEPMETVLAAARELGTGPYANLGVAVSKQKRGGLTSARGGYVHAGPINDPWLVTKAAELRDKVMQDPQAVAWITGVA